jgi:hypothetical protein
LPVKWLGIGDLGQFLIPDRIAIRTLGRSIK